MKVAVDQDKCCAAGICVTLAPDVFDQRDEDGVVVLLDNEPPEDMRAALREAAGSCPAMAIELTEES